MQGILSLSRGVAFLSVMLQGEKGFQEGPPVKLGMAQGFLISVDVLTGVLILESCSLQLVEQMEAIKLFCLSLELNQLNLVLSQNVSHSGVLCPPLGFCSDGFFVLGFLSDSGFSFSV